MPALSVGRATFTESRSAAEDVSKTVSDSGCSPPPRHQAASAAEQHQSAARSTEERRALLQAFIWVDIQLQMPHRIIPQATRLAEGS